MDPEERVRRALAAAGGDVWDLLDAAVAVAAMDHDGELRARRDAIVERLYGGGGGRCRNCEPSPSPPPEAAAQSPEPEAVEDDIDDECGGGGGGDAAMENKILAIRDFLEDPDQSEDELASLLQNLADMDITYKALKETDIGRHVNGLRRHPSGEVRRLVKQLVRKWKEIVDAWVRSNNPGGAGDEAAIITDGDSPQKIPSKNYQNSNQVSEFKFSPSPIRHHGSSSERNNGLDPVEPKEKPGPRADGPTHQQKPKYNHPSPSSAPPPARMVKEQKSTLLDPDKLDSARKRLQENYQEAQNAKRQRTIQVMELQDIPKPKKAFFRKGGGGGFPAKHR